MTAGLPGPLSLRRAKMGFHLLKLFIEVDRFAATVSDGVSSGEGSQDFL